MIDLVGVLTVGLAFLVVAASPGPATLATATVSMSAGRTHGFRFGLGLTCGLAVWGLVAATGLGALLQTSAIALAALKVAGGAYLFWLAYGSLRSARQPARAPSAAVPSGNWFTRGLILNLSNPKAVVAWMATLSLGVTDTAGAWQVAVSTALCIALGFAVYCAFVLIFSTKGAMQTYTRLRRWIDGAVAVFFAGAGLGLIRSALSR